MQSSLIKSLELCWHTIDTDYGYAISILKKMGYERSQNRNPEYLKLWAKVNTGKLIGKDVSQLETLLDKENERFTKSIEDLEKYEKERLQLDMAKSSNDLESEIKSLRQQLALMQSK